MLMRKPAHGLGEKWSVVPWGRPTQIAGDTPRGEHAMRLKPAVSQEEALRYLAQNATLVWGVAAAARMEGHLNALARSMAVVSALDVPDMVEPLFGENIDIDLVEALP
jgi:hypothetical protein